MSIAVIAATMMGTRKKYGPFGSLLFPGDPFTLFPAQKEEKKLSDKKEASQSITISRSPGTVKNGTTTTSDVKSESSAPNKQEKAVRTVKKARKKVKPDIDEKFVMAVVEKVKVELPTLIEQLNNTPSRKIVSQTYDTVYRLQIAAAQQFLNENRSADLSRVKCLLHKLLPREYFEYVEQLREHQDPQTIINIMGGQNIVAPNAKEACQSFQEKDTGNI